MLCKRAPGQRRPQWQLSSNLFTDGQWLKLFPMHLLCKCRAHGSECRQCHVSQGIFYRRLDGAFISFKWSIEKLQTVSHWVGRLHGVSDKQGVISDHRGSRFKSRSVVTSADMFSFPHQSEISVLASILPPPSPLLTAFQESILCRPSIVSGSESRGKFTICRSVDVLASTLGWAIVMVPATYHH